uniref:Uncharacterized protein n=1 Tax=Opuntia streptacantha TaxID=393608 RepID=A0A7C8ZXC5_OPUST
MQYIFLSYFSSYLALRSFFEVCTRTASFSNKFLGPSANQQRHTASISDINLSHEEARVKSSKCCDSCTSASSSALAQSIRSRNNRKDARTEDDQELNFSQ